MTMSKIRGFPAGADSARSESVMIGSGYFWFYASIGAFTPYTALYYQHLGFSGVELGALVALPALMTALSGPFWGAYADARAAHRAILRTVPLIAAVIAVMLSQVTGYVPFLATLGVLAMVLVPVPALLDSYGVSAVERGGASFGVLRIFGSLGFTAMVLATGALMAGGMSNRFFFAYAAAHVLTWSSALFLPKLSERRHRRLLDGISEVRRRKPFVLLLVVAYLIATGMSMFNNFLGIHIDRLGGSTGIVGVAFAVAAISELPVIGFGSRIMRRLGARHMVMVALAAYIVRFSVLALAPSAEWVVAAQLMHGVSFAMFLVASVNLAHRIVGPENAATGQALLGSMSFGFGSITGALIGGALLDVIGTRWLYTGVVGIMVVALAVYVIGNRLLARESFEPSMEQPATG
jgi:PPP family 3-phenylpropionic acid transporter